MARPPTSPRILLIADRRVSGEAPAPVAPLRRYRLARLRLGTPPAGPDGRFGYLKRIYD